MYHQYLHVIPEQDDEELEGYSIAKAKRYPIVIKVPKAL